MDGKTLSRCVEAGLSRLFQHLQLQESQMMLARGAFADGFSTEAQTILDEQKAINDTLRLAVAASTPTTTTAN